MLDQFPDLREEMAAHRPEDRDAIPRVRRTLKRILTILKTMVAQVDIVETMTPISFNSFRDRLETASGFQSPQFREVEFVLGNRSEAMLEHHRENPAAFDRLRRRLEEPTRRTLWRSRGVVPRRASRRSARRSSRSIAATIDCPASASSWSIWTKVSRSGGTAT